LTNVHIFTAPWQPLTRYVVEAGGKRTVRHKPRTVSRCHSCWRRRWAANLEIAVYYDTVKVRCAGGCRRASR